MSPWLKTALKYTGTKEIKGVKHNWRILSWWRVICAPFRDDETPWCAAFVGGVLEECGIRSTRSAAARSYEKWGVKLDKAAVGAVVVFWRGSLHSGSGHVGFVVGRNLRNDIMVVGGNQGDAVSIKPFAVNRILGYRWPANIAKPVGSFMSLPLMASNEAPSTNEA
jgi:uncharacterized protein (TIGR02594 family)